MCASGHIMYQARYIMKNEERMKVLRDVRNLGCLDVNGGKGEEWS